MALIRWEPARELTTIQSEMNRLFNSFFDSPTGSGSGGFSTRRWLPAMDVAEVDGEYVLRTDLPGVSEQDVSVELKDNVLTISGERKLEREDRKEGYHRVERSSGSFARSLRLPEGIDPEMITAGFDKGVLEVKIPKPEQRKPHKVAVTAGGEQAKAIEGSESTD
jgi:HSP20 family protein